MRRAWPWLLLAVVPVLASCPASAPDASVRFHNATSDAVIPYGIRLGEAEFIGDFPPGTLTTYAYTPAGSFGVQERTSDGAWLADPRYSFDVYAGRRYTLRMVGSALAYEYWVVQDF